LTYLAERFTHEISGPSIAQHDDWLDDMAWTECNFSREIINTKGRALVRLFNVPYESWTNEDWADNDTMLPVINNWRSCHAYPLNVLQTNLRRAARRVDPAALIAQRTKRLVSIAIKLDSRPKMKLTQMQDIGGCRAVVKSAAAVRKLDEFYQSGSQMKHILASRDDYIANPRESGYRGIHRVYRFYSDKEGGKRFNDLKIELQLRSQYQHAWATAVETVGTFVGEALKSSSGPEEWLRFFALMSSTIAVRERAPLVPGTPTRINELMFELDEVAYELNVEHRLRAYNDALQRFENDTEGAHYYLLKLDPKTGILGITGFKVDEAEKAQQAYAEAETKGQSATDAVLVAVDSLAALQRAYPNYFADTRVFLELLRQVRSGKNRRVFTGQLRLPLTVDSRSKDNPSKE
jgi:ppGpp synthetase/RelA/SpoT-type nucleotidyltranferase